MLLKLLCLMVMGVLSTTLYAFPCFFTLIKSNCWANYSIAVTVLDANTNKEFTSLKVAKGSTWVRHEMNCQPGQKFMYHATYAPVFWQSETGKVYNALRYWSLPTEIDPKKAAAWNIPICFPGDFAAIPLPPDAASGNCACDWSQVPEIKQ